MCSRMSNTPCPAGSTPVRNDGHAAHECDGCTERATPRAPRWARAARFGRSPARSRGSSTSQSAPSQPTTSTRFDMGGQDTGAGAGGAPKSPAFGTTSVSSRRRSTSGTRRADRSPRTRARSKAKKVAGSSTAAWLMSSGVLEPAAPLQPREARLPLRVHHDDLAVDDALVERQRLHRARDLGEDVGVVVAVAREEQRRRRRACRDQAIAVELELEQPAVARERVVRRSRRA